jgi:hypothetical protein
MLARGAAPLAILHLLLPIASSADEAIAPMSWDDPIFGSPTPIPGNYNLPGGQSLSGIECDEPTVPFGCVIMNWPPGPGLASLTFARLRSSEGIRRRGAPGSESLVEWVYIEISSFSGDHADGIQHEGGESPATVRHTYIKMNPTPGQTAGLFAADGSTGHLELDHVIFDGGPRGLVVACDGATSVSMNHVYFINGSFDTAGYHLNAGMFTAPLCNGTGWTLTRWDDVWNADIVDGELVPTDPIPAPCTVPCVPPSVWGGGGVPDRDQDGVPNDDDFCSLDAAAPYPFGCDTDRDGIGNACDGDLNNDGAQDFNDIPIFMADLGDGIDDGVGSDANCDGSVDYADIGPFTALITDTGVPGPSGLDCAGTAPCP